MLWAWGAGNHGQLLIGQDDHSLPIAVDPKGRVEKLVGGGAHSLIAVEGELRSAGSNEEGQLGVDLKNRGNSDHNDIQIVFERDVGVIESLACGWSHSLIALTSNQGGNLVFGCGSNEFGQLGLNVTRTSIPTQIPMEVGAKVTKVACGLRHSALLLDSGALFLFGENRFGQCSNASLETVTTPTRVNISELVISVALGARHTLIGTDKGEIFAVGENRFGQCGQELDGLPILHRKLSNGKTKAVTDVIASPMRVQLGTVKNPSNLVLRCGWNFSLVWISCDQDDTVILFGRNNYGQLGLGMTSHYEHRPQTLDLSNLGARVLQIECGSEHTLLLDDKQQVWSFGWNEHGQLGHGDEVDRHSLTLISELSTHNINRISAGYGFSFAMSAERDAE
jgi:secretion-regulating guanine nucleotide exchange factor